MEVYILGHVTTNIAGADLNLFKRGFEEEKEGLRWKFRKIYMFIQTNVAPDLYEIDLEVPQLRQLPAYWLEIS